MLTKESSSGFSPSLNYPTYRYLSRSGNREQANFDGSRMSTIPRGYREVIEYHNEDEHFADYLKWNTEDHKDIPDQRMAEHPYGIFHGHFRNARWFDEAKRRGLVEPTV